MATNVYKPVHETTERVNNDKVTAIIIALDLMHADEHTKVFVNQIEELGQYIKR